MKIKAIETQYKGYKFRSRLEARWAVFFDKMGIKYQYELEGYETKHGWYLPDFFLPEFNCWVEVKGNYKSIDVDKEKLIEVCYATSAIGIFLCGDPVDCFESKCDEDLFTIHCGDVTDGSGGEFCGEFKFCHLNGVPHLIPDSTSDGCRGRMYMTVDMSDYVKRIVDMPDNRKAPKVSTNATHKAAIAARQARFEHGARI